MHESFELFKLQYESLREEIMEKIKLSHQLGYYKLIAIGAMLGVTIAKGVDQQYIKSLFLAVMLLPVVFDAALYFNGKAIVKVGIYIRTHIEPNFKIIAGIPDDILLWEEYIVAEAPDSSGLHRLWWNLFEGVQPAITIALQSIIFPHLLEGGFTWLAVVGCFAIIIEVFLMVQAVRRR